MKSEAISGCSEHSKSEHTHCLAWSFADIGRLFSRICRPSCTKSIVSNDFITCDGIFCGRFWSILGVKIWVVCAVSVGVVVCLSFALDCFGVDVGLCVKTSENWVTSFDSKFELPLNQTIPYKNASMNKYGVTFENKRTSFIRAKMLA